MLTKIAVAGLATGGLMLAALTAPSAIAARVGGRARPASRCRIWRQAALPICRRARRTRPAALTTILAPALASTAAIMGACITGAVTA
jgi:hypothetical protein